MTATDSHYGIGCARWCLLHLLLAVCGCASWTEWKPFEHAWAAAQDAESVENGVVGAWAGPWRNETTGKVGLLMVVIGKSKTEGSELVGTFQRGDETGRMRLRRIEPCPDHFFVHVPGVVSVEHSPDELTDQLKAIKEMDLDAPESVELDSRGQVLPTSFRE